jgi:hypothetical protein
MGGGRRMKAKGMKMGVGDWFLVSSPSYEMPRLVGFGKSRAERVIICLANLGRRVMVIPPRKRFSVDGLADSRLESKACGRLKYLRLLSDITETAQR